MRPISMNSSLFVTALLLAACNPDKDTPTDTIDTFDTSASDNDGDGYTSLEDCDDNDASINPGAEESCNGLDDDCDGDIDEETTGTYYADGDGDGFGDAGASTEACEASAGWVPNASDCDDENPSIYPEAEELCDGLDNDCDGTVDNGLPGGTWYADTDGDNYGNPDESLDACEQPPGYVDNALDCDDSNSLEPVHVDDDAGSATGTGSATNPLDTVQGGIDLANVCVFVSAGTYNENVDFNGKNVMVYGVDGAEATSIVGTGDGSVVTFANKETSDAGLTGFTIMGGSGRPEVTTDYSKTGSGSEVVTTTYRYYGGGIYVDGANPQLWDLVVKANALPAYSYSNPAPDTHVYVYSYGGGLFASDSNIEPWSITFAENYADAGGGAYVNSSSNVSLKWATFDANTASSGGGLTATGTAAAHNSLFVNNSSDGTGGAVGGAAAHVIDGAFNASFTNFAGNDGVAAIYLSGSAELTLNSSILVDNDDGYLVDGDVGSSLDASYSDAYGGAAGSYGSVLGDPTGSNGNISEDPAFTAWSDDGDSSNDNWTLTPKSPCVNAGDPAETDPDGTTADMGMYGGADGAW